MLTAVDDVITPSEKTLVEEGDVSEDNEDLSSFNNGFFVCGSLNRKRVFEAIADLSTHEAHVSRNKVMKFDLY